MSKYFVCRYNNFRALLRTDPAEFWHNLLYISFWINIAFFPVGYGFREVMPPLSFIFLILYYKNGWKNSVLANLKPAWLFLCPLAMIIIGVVFSIHPWQSFLHAGMGANKAYILPFIAMECVRNEKEITNIIWAFVFSCFWEGIDGIWQAATGYDFIMGYALNGGRLTGSLGDYTVGNFMALALIPASGIWFIIRGRFGRYGSIFIITALFWPAIFILLGASARSSILALAGSASAWVIFSRGLKNLKVLIYPGLIFALYIIFQPNRLTIAKVASDNRWDLWQIAWKIFEEHPFLGAGAGQYNTAFREMGLKPLREVITISHPHNLYIDILYAHGIIGFTLCMIFLFGFLFWGIKNIIPPLREEISCRSQNYYWRLTSIFALAFIGWLINGIFGHDFYRIWWLAMAMTSLGLMIGAVVNGKLERK